MPYPELMIAPMRKDLTNIGFTELMTGEDVDQFMANAKGISLFVINSVCGCAAGSARPAVLHALQQATVKPDHLVTVFAGQEVEATNQARSHFPMLPPSSPSFVILKDGEVADYIPRHRIEMRGPEEIAADIVAAFDAAAAGAE